MTKQKGRNLLVFVDGSAIAGETSCELSMNMETIEVASQTQAEFKEYLTKRKSWSVSSSHLMILDSTESNVAKFKNLLGTKVLVAFDTTADSNDARATSARTADNVFSLSGYAIVTDCTITAKNGDYVSGSFKFQGTGALS